MLATAVALAGCGESSLPPTTLAVQRYLTALAEGNYPGACALLDRRTRRVLARRLGRRASCPAAFARCLPNRAQVARHDQSQLLFATVDVTQTGHRASAVVNGTLVADALRQVTLAKEGKQWMLTSYGQGLGACHAHRGRRRPRPRRSHRAA